MSPSFDPRDARELARDFALPERAAHPARASGPLTPTAIVEDGAVDVWRAPGVEPSPHFYPVYRHGDLWSHSLLSLLLAKGEVTVDRRAARRAGRPGFKYYSGLRTIDAETRRIGRPLPRGPLEVCTPEDFAAALADALREDVAAVEARHPGATNVVLCGGRDSLNLLLVPWKNPTLVASAPPNYPLVCEFVSRHALGYEVIPLVDDDDLLPWEIVAAACRISLNHCRWSRHLRSIALELGPRCLFWKGQLGDTFTTDFFRTYTHSRTIRRLRHTAVAMASVVGAGARMRRFAEESRLAQGLFVGSLFWRGAMWQGVHGSLLRTLVQRPFLSGYHGPAVERLLGRVDLARAVGDDMRPLVGERLFGRPVQYPEENPGPPARESRLGRSSVGDFAAAVRELGLPLSVRGALLGSSG